jgi:hypothetical protein
MSEISDAYWSARGRGKGRSEAVRKCARRFNLDEASVKRALARAARDEGAPPPSRHNPSPETFAGLRKTGVSHGGCEAGGKGGSREPTLEADRSRERVVTLDYRTRREAGVRHEDAVIQTAAKFGVRARDLKPQLRVVREELRGQRPVTVAQSTIGDHL